MKLTKKQIEVKRQELKSKLRGTQLYDQGGVLKALIIYLQDLGEDDIVNAVKANNACQLLFK